MVILIVHQEYLLRVGPVRYWALWLRSCIAHKHVLKLGICTVQIKSIGSIHVFKCCIIVQSECLEPERIEAQEDLDCSLLGKASCRQPMRGIVLPADRAAPCIRGGSEVLGCRGYRSQESLAQSCPFFDVLISEMVGHRWSRRELSVFSFHRGQADHALQLWKALVQLCKEGLPACMPHHHGMAEQRPLTIWLVMYWKGNANDSFYNQVIIYPTSKICSTLVI